MTKLSKEEEEVMKISSIVLFLLSLLAQPAMAAASKPTNTLGSGPYFGAQIGWLSMRADVSHSINAPVFFTNLNINQQVASDGLFGDIHLGYGVKMERFYLGYELFGNLNGGEDDGYIIGTYGGNPLVLSFSYRAQGSLGVDVLPGFYPTETARVYAHLGFIETRYQLWSESFGINRGDKNKWSPGFRFGLGMQSKWTEHLVVRADATYNVFSSWMPYDTPVVKIKFSPRTYNGMIGLDYMFN